MSVSLCDKEEEVVVMVVFWYPYELEVGINVTFEDPTPECEWKLTLSVLYEDVVDSLVVISEVCEPSWSKSSVVSVDANTVVGDELFMSSDLLCGNNGDNN